ncbi:hypothetical protein EYC84_012050 [Monilinia fructicola]|uniref:Uncharacterized protein n=1 Tax=Monilinia fructicola TaxID=38448 RepID=A0A5M9J511_MONFR|nr:hypothetical protein EYC84_012050 [Monilinia fructicola]
MITIYSLKDIILLILIPFSHMAWHISLKSISLPLLLPAPYPLTLILGHHNSQLMLAAFPLPQILSMQLVLLQSWHQ